MQMLFINMSECINTLVSTNDCCSCAKDGVINFVAQNITCLSDHYADIVVSYGCEKITYFSENSVIGYCALSFIFGIIFICAVGYLVE
jgi:hypothetical protein